MKEKLQSKILLCLLALGGMQLAYAQYPGVAFGGTTPTIGATAGSATTIEFENYDALSSEPTGSGANNPSDVFPADPVSSTGTYYDSNSASSKNPEVRTGSTVSFFTDPAALIDEGTDPVTITMVNGQAGGEWLLYTIDVKTAGAYTFKMRYRSGAGGRQVKLSSYPLDLSTETVLSEIPLEGTRNSANKSVFKDSQDVAVTLAAGVQVLKVTWISGTLGADVMTFTLNDGTASVEDANSSTQKLKVFPNPATNGKFNLSTSTNWKVYSVLGVKVLEGFGNSIDLSSLAKGAYMLKADNVSKMLLSK